MQDSSRISRISGIADLFGSRVALAFMAAVVALSAGLPMILSGSALAPLAGFGLGLALAALPAFVVIVRIRDAGSRRELELTRMLEDMRDQQWESRENEQAFRGLDDSFGDLVLHRDTAGLVLSANDAFCRAFGLPLSALQGSQFEPRILSEAAGGPRPQTAREVEIETPQGPRWYRWIDVPVRDAASGKTIIRTTARDVTEARNAVLAQEAARARAEESSQAKSRFLAMVSHEMRTPLNGILGMSDLLRDTSLSPEQAAYVSAIGGSGRALLGLIEDMLDMTLIESGRLVLREGAFEPLKLTEEVCELLAPRAHERNIELTCHVAAQTPLLVSGDVGRMRQVLINLVGNAIKFTEKGGVSVEVTPAEIGGAPALRFDIEDTGPGLKPEDQARIFEEFEQADNAATRRHGGAGLGLSISQRIVREMGGRISVRSEPSRGSTFSFEIPLSVREAARPTLRQMGGQVVLILSAGRIEAGSLARTIRALGGEAVILHRLGEARQWLRTARADAVVMDAALSRDPDRSLARLLRGLDNRPFSVILLRPSDRAGLKSHLAHGFDGWLIRPLRQASVIQVLADRQTGKPEPASDGKGLAPTAATGDLRRLDILLAEDNPINALLARTALERAGQQVHAARDGREAVSRVRERLKRGGRFDIILMDIHMPGMDGLTATRAIRRMERKAGVPRAAIYFLSADEQAKTREDSLAAGGDGFLTKPVAPSALIELVRDQGKQAA